MSLAPEQRIMLRYVCLVFLKLIYEILITFRPAILKAQNFTFSIQ